MGREPQAARRTVVYCIVPADLAGRLHEPLRRHFAGEPAVEVVVEQRWRDRRRSLQRRTDERPVDHERRKIRAADGRRVADRRSSAVVLDPPAGLPRRARGHVAQLAFVEVLEPTTLELEDRDSARLVARIQAGDRDLFGELYLRYFDRVYTYVHVVLRDSHEAEDATQQIFLKLLDALPRYERRAQPFRAWLFVIVRNHVLTLLARNQRMNVSDPAELDRQREGESASDATDAEIGVLGWLSDRELLMLVERLPVAQQQVLLLRFMLDLSDLQTAEILGRSREDVRALQHRAMCFLRERLTALGRAPRDHARRPLRRCPNQAFVLRMRRFSLVR